MDIFYFKDLGDTECHLDANVVVLVLGECQISITMYLSGYLSSYKVVLQCIGNWQCYDTLKSSQTDRHTDRHTASIQ